MMNGLVTHINFFIGISGNLPMADKSAPTDVPIILLMCITTLLLSQGLGGLIG
jgi:hypothetical protein